MSVNAQAVRKAIFTPQFVTALLVGLIVGVAGFGILFRPVALQDASLQFQRPYPMPHQYWATTDEFYVFASGGQQGGFYVYGLPSMKYLSEIPIFSTDQAWGWTPEDPELRAFFTNPWTGEVVERGDTHHPSMSKTDGVYDGRWVFLNDKMYGRVARVDLTTFRADQVVWMPNTTGGAHGFSIGPNTELAVLNIEHEQVPDPVIQDLLGLEIDLIEGPYVGGFSGISIDGGPGGDGTMEVEWQVWGPWQHDMARIGWGESEGWIVNTSYNTERAMSSVPMFQREQDYLYFWNIASIEKAIADGKFVTTEQAPDVAVVSWEDVEVYMTEIPLNPHGLDISPTGKYILSSGKATTLVVAIDFNMVEEAIAAEDFQGEEFGIPILTTDSVREATMDLGLGPTHIEFDDKGYAYIGFFVDSDAKKIAMGGPYSELNNEEEPWTVVDVMPAHYSIGHIMIPGGDMAEPYGKYFIAMNKLAKDTFLPHGPLISENHELYTIGDEAAQLVDQMALGPETHYSQAIPVSMITENVKGVYALPASNVPPNVDYDYTNEVVTVNMNVVRSWFTPDMFTVPEGWTVNIIMASQEQALDITHGLAIDGYDVSASLDPGDVKQVEFVADKTGVHWYYCIWFCSELHMEMRGRMIVIPQDEWTPDLEVHLP
jgi:nitrous-oxide reductase